MGPTNFESNQSMNSTALTTTKIPPSGFGPADNSEEIDFGHYADVLVANRWLIAAVTLVVFLAGVLYAMLQRPVYESNIVVQVEDAAPDANGKGALGEANGLVEIKSQASAEME